MEIREAVACNDHEDRLHALERELEAVKAQYDKVRELIKNTAGGDRQWKIATLNLRLHP